MNKRPSVVVAGVAAVWLILSASVAGQTAEVVGTVRDETGHVLPGVSVDVRDEQGAARETITDASGAYRFDSLEPGTLQLSFALINFSAVRRDVVVAAAGSLRIDIVLRVALNADVTVTG